MSFNAIYGASEEDELDRYLIKKEFPSEIETLESHGSVVDFGYWKQKNTQRFSQWREEFTAILLHLRLARETSVHSDRIERIADATQNSTFSKTWLFVDRCWKCKANKNVLEKAQINNMRIWDFNDWKIVHVVRGQDHLAIQESPSTNLYMNRFFIAHKNQLHKHVHFLNGSLLIYATIRYFNHLASQTCE